MKILTIPIGRTFSLTFSEGQIIAEKIYNSQVPKIMRRVN